MTIKTKDLYRPRTQSKALEFASAQAESKTSTISRYFAWLLFQKMSETEREIIGLVSEQYHHLIQRGTKWNSSALNSIEKSYLFNAINQIITQRGMEIIHLTERWLASGYVWGYVGFLYQVDCLTPPQIKPKAEMSRQRVDQRLGQAQGTEQGGKANFRHRIEAQSNQLNRELQRTLEQSMLMQESLMDVVGRIKHVFGTETKRKITESLREQGDEEIYIPGSTGPPYEGSVGSVIGSGQSPIDGVLDDQYWDSAVSDLRTAMDWEHRQPGYYTPDGGSAYAFERDVMTDYAAMVRTGQVDARMPNGEVIDDFVWVVAEDKGTCEDCEAREDLTMTEIADKLGDDSAPPLHPNCNCALIPSLPDFQPLAGDWASDGEPPDSRLITDPYTGDSGYPGVDDFDTWMERSQ